MLLDKQKYLEHIKDSSQLIIAKKLLDKIQRVIRYHNIEYTDFLDPFQRRICYSILNRINDINFIEDGGYDESERRIIIIHPNYIDKEYLEDFVSVLEINGNFKYNEICHRDILGSILGLGIKREKIGDIYLNGDYGYIVTLKEITDFLIFNLNRIKKSTVKLITIDKTSIKPIIRKYITKELTVSSMRLDSLISQTFNMSRYNSLRLIKLNKVKVNHELIYKADKKINEGDLISVRGNGRMVLKSILGLSKKGKIKCLIELYK